MRIFQSDHSVRMAKIDRVRAHVKRCPSVVGRSCTQVLSTYVRVYVIVVLARSPYAPVLHVELAFIILGEAVYYLRGTVRKWIRWTSSGEAFQRVPAAPPSPPEHLRKYDKCKMACILYIPRVYYDVNY